MKHLVKNIAVLWFSVLFILLSINSSYAEEIYMLKAITATSTKTVELELDKKTNQLFTQSDLEIYKSIWNIAEIVENEENKVILKMNSDIEKNTSYSLISVSAIEWNIIFKTWNDILGKEIQNTTLEWSNQWIKSILIKDQRTIVLNFIQNIWAEDLEFQLLKTLEVEKIISLTDSTKIKATLKTEMLNNEEYLWTLTYLETSTFNKVEISKGIYYFKTGELVKYEWPTEEELALENTTVDNLSLEESLMQALNETTDSNLSEWETELQSELNSAAEDPANTEKTQLENLALSQKETPDTGAETWVILLATFIINTFYYLSRRKKNTLA